jgi:uncharacterized protein YcbK (DUF882 family)
MISLQELNPHNYPTTPEIDANLQTLLERVNVIRAAWGKPMIVTSGLRSQADQARINPNAPKSKHLIGAACDVYDPDGELKKWVLDNVKLFEDTGLWMEAFSSTPTWVHMQCIPPHSGNRFFIP